MANGNYQHGMHTQQMPPQSQQYQQYQQQQYQQPRQMYLQPNDTTTTGQWVLNLFLVAIPIIGLILLFVWAFGSNTPPSKQNWARANLIWILIAILLSIILAVIATVMGISIPDVLARYGYRY